jgi:hypothetical protein
MYACDFKWWDMHHEALEFKGERWTQDLKAYRKFGLSWVLGSSKSGLGRDCVHFGGNSGYQAINLAYLWGAKRIILLGFDAKPVGDKHHWFGQHPEGLVQIQPYQLWLNHYPKLAKDLLREGVEVINCSVESAIQCFTKKQITEI